MIHLRIADLLLKRIDELDADAFLIGNIGPDSGLPNADWTQFDPPKRVTHWEDKSAEWLVGDWHFFQAYMTDADKADTHRYSFLLGYFFHLVTDNLWIRDVWRPVKGQLSDPPTTEDIALVKRDWYGQDFIYIRAHREDAFWQRFQSAEYDPAWFDLVPAAGINHSLNYIRTFYARTDEPVQAFTNGIIIF